MNVADERARAVHEHAKAWKLPKAAADEAFPLRWKSNSLFVQCTFFVLTCLALGAFYALFDNGFVLAVVAIGLAETLIHTRRWFGTGVEQALWLGGVFGVISELPHSSSNESILVVAFGVAVAGFRLRNPLFGAAAAVLVAVYFEHFDRGTLATIILGSVALLALLRTWQRPSTEWLFALIAVAMPIAGYVMADARWRDVTMLLYGVFGAAAFGLALWKRHHAMFLAGFEGIAVAAIELSRMIAAPLETKIAAGGALLLVGSWIVSRVLRDRTNGFVMTPARLTSADEALQIAATLAVAPRETETPPEIRPEGDGSFGGAGATGHL